MIDFVFRAGYRLLCNIKNINKCNFLTHTHTKKEEVCVRILRYLIQIVK